MRYMETCTEKGSMILRISFRSMICSTDVIVLSSITYCLQQQLNKHRLDAKLQAIPQLLAKWKGKGDQLVIEVARKYNCLLSNELAGGPSAWRRSVSVPRAACLTVDVIYTVAC